MTKKALLYFPFDILNKSNNSLKLKTESIARSLEKQGFKLDIVYHSGKENILLNGELLTNPRSYNKIERVVNNYALIDFKDKLDTNYDLVFFRTKMASPYLERVLKFLRKSNPNAKIILEYPTYPFANEYSNLILKFYVKYIDRYFRSRHSRFADFCVVYSEETEILGLPALPISNGYNWDLELEKPKIDKFPANTDFILTGISSHLANYHAYDRVVDGLANYYIKKSDHDPNVIFQIVGGGEEVDVLLKKASDLGIDGKVKKTGPKSTSEIIEILDQSTMAVGGLGLHRKNLVFKSPLKSSFYCFSGIPFIDAGIDKRFANTEFDFRFDVGANDEPVDLFSVINYYDQLKSNHFNYKQVMHEYAIKNLSWDRQVSKILEAI